MGFRSWGLGSGGGFGIKGQEFDSGFRRHASGLRFESFGSLFPPPPPPTSIAAAGRSEVSPASTSQGPLSSSRWRLSRPGPLNLLLLFGTVALQAIVAACLKTVSVPLHDNALRRFCFILHAAITCKMFRSVILISCSPHGGFGLC